MFFRSRPDVETIRRHLERQSKAGFSYEELEMTRGGFDGVRARFGDTRTIDRDHVRLGQGGAYFERACAAVGRWAMFDVGWAEICWSDAPQVPGTTVGVLARLGPLWSLSACRVVYALDGDARSFGFAYGTLPDHGVSGEELFRVEWRADDSVWWERLAVSRRIHWSVRLGRPAVRHVQRRFGRDSLVALRLAIEGS